MKFVQDVLDLRAQYFTIAETSFLDLATQQTDRHFARVLKEVCHFLSDVACRF